MVTNSRMPDYKTFVFSEVTGRYRLFHHATCIVDHCPHVHTICFNTDGWYSPTTKQRINIYLSLKSGLKDWKCYQRNFVWYLKTHAKELTFDDNMVVDTITGELIDDHLRLPYGHHQRLFCSNGIVNDDAA